MNFAWLDDFLALAASGNFSRAAQARNMTQPAFSRRIRALEEWLGVELFDRSSQPARLTAAGEWFGDVARELVQRVARVPLEARAVAEAGAGTLCFAATHALSFSFLPTWLRAVESRSGLGAVELMSDVLQRCEAALLQGRVQFVLSHAHAAAPDALGAAGCPSLCIGRDMLVPVMKPLTNPGEQGGQPLDAAAATALPLLGYSSESGLGRIVQAVLGQRLDALPVQRVFTAHLASVLRTMALDGRGIAWLPATLVADDLAAGRLVHAGGSGWQVALEIRLYRDKAALGPAGEALWQSALAESDGK